MSFLFFHHKTVHWSHRLLPTLSDCNGHQRFKPAFSSQSVDCRERRVWNADIRYNVSVSLVSDRAQWQKDWWQLCRAGKYTCCVQHEHVAVISTDVSLLLSNEHILQNTTIFRQRLQGVLGKMGNYKKEKKARRQNKAVMWLYYSEVWEYFNNNSSRFIGNQSNLIWQINVLNEQTTKVFLLTAGTIDSGHFLYSISIKLKRSQGVCVCMHACIQRFTSTSH